MRDWRILLTLSVLLGFASISTDFYLPAMPAMAIALQASHGSVEWTVTGYLLGFSIGQLFWGPVSDRFGRRIPITLGIVLFIVGSIGCALSVDVGILIASRVVQALGACAGVVLARAMVRDLYRGDRAAQVMSLLMTVMAFAPLVGPYLGGQILVYAGWRVIFWLLVAIGLVTLVAVLRMPESHAPDKRNPRALNGMAQQYLSVVTDGRFLAHAAAIGIFYAGTFAYIAASPFVYINYFGLPATRYGLVFGTGIIGIVLVNLVGTRLIGAFGSRRVLLAASCLSGAASVVLAVSWIFGGGLLGVVIPMFFYVSVTGLIVSTAIAGALAAFADRAGMASALIGAIQYGCGIIGSGAVGFLADGTPMPMIAILFVAGLGCLGFARLATRGRQPD